MKVEPNQQNKQQCYGLWKDCFGDSDQYMNYYFTEKTKDNEIFQIERDGEVISMLHLNPFTFLVNGVTQKLNYIVGVATKESERGQGLMRTVLTDTLCRQAERGEAFTYLMPAAKEIYLPYDFRYMYTQSRVTGVLALKEEMAVTMQEVKAEPAVSYESLTDEEKEQVVLFVNEKLQASFDCVVLRDKAYYERLCKEMQAAGGNVVVARQAGRLLGVCAFMLENGHIEVVETITTPSDTREVLTKLNAFLQEEYEEVSLQAAWLETYFLDKEALFSELEEAKEVEQPIIMARLLHLEHAFSLLRQKEGAEPSNIVVCIEDPIIKANQKTFAIEGTADGIKISETNEEPALTVAIAELTEWYFGVREIPQLQGIQTLTSPYINDIV